VHSPWLKHKTRACNIKEWQHCPVMSPYHLTKRNTWAGELPGCSGIVLLDEPTHGLTPAESQQYLRTLHALAAQHVSHSMFHLLCCTLLLYALAVRSCCTLNVDGNNCLNCMFFNVFCALASLAPAAALLPHCNLHKSSLMHVDVLEHSSRLEQVRTSPLACQCVCTHLGTLCTAL
jgi:ABC-type transport system involved in cytochrome bd biosynthesis fused ATPase/permease subunit